MKIDKCKLNKLIIIFVKLLNVYKEKNSNLNFEYRNHASIFKK